MTSSASTVTVPDSIFDKSRMSVMRLSRSVPAPWTVRANLDLLRTEIALGVVGQLLPQNQNAVQRRPQFVRHVREELRLVARRQRQLRRLFFERATRLFDFLILALDLDVLFGQLLRLLRQLFVGLLQFLLPGLQLRRQLLRLLQQAFGLHRRLDAVHQNADAIGELFEEGEVDRRKFVERRQAENRLDFALEHDRENDQAARHRLEHRGADRNSVRRQAGHENALLVDDALAEEALPHFEALCISSRRIAVAG
jgi:hypothetical protein